MKKTTKKSQKKKKKQRSLVLLLFLTIIMLGTSTYAWFTANRVVTINDINVSVEASDGIQISTDAVNWKSVITNTEITSGYAGANNVLPSTVTAVSTDGLADIDSNSDTLGQLPMYIATITNGEGGNYYITTARDAESNGHFIAFDVFLRVSQPKTIYLTTDSKVIANGEDKGLKNAARIAFVNKGHANTNATSAALIALNSPTQAAILWEPNADTHSDVVTNSVAADYNVTLGSNSTQYYGVNQAFSTAQELKGFVRNGHATYTTAMTPSLITPAANSTYRSIFSLTTGITKFRVYMWIEGQDIDCENNATGSNITFKLQLSTESSASGAASSAPASSSSE